MIDSFYNILDHKEFIYDINNYKNVDSKIMYPINIQRIIDYNIKNNNKISNISPIDIINKNNILKDKLKLNY